jgi:hypothetical protein
MRNVSAILRFSEAGLFPCDGHMISVLISVTEKGAHLPQNPVALFALF